MKTEVKTFEKGGIKTTVEADAKGIIDLYKKQGWKEAKAAPPAPSDEKKALDEARENHPDTTAKPEVPNEIVKQTTRAKKSTAPVDDGLVKPKGGKK